MKLENQLKNKVISTYRKFGNDKSLVIKGKRSYSGYEIADEIDRESDLGVKILNNLLSLTIDLLRRNKISYD